MLKKPCAHLLLILLTVVTAACSATQVVQSWKNPQIVRPKSVMVFGVTKEETVRRTYEDAVSSALSAQGLPTTPSYNVIKVHGEVKPEEAADAVRRAGADAVLITRLVRLAKDVQIAPDISPGPPFGYGAGDPFYSPFWPSYYYNSYRLIERELAYVESNLYKADSSALLISVLTRTEDPNYSPRQIQEITGLIVQEFRRANLLPPEP